MKNLLVLMLASLLAARATRKYRTSPKTGHLTCSCLTFLSLTEIQYRKEMTFRNPSCTTVRKSVILRGVKRGSEVFRNQINPTDHLRRPVSPQ